MKIPLTLFRSVTLQALRSLGHSPNDAVIIGQAMEYAELRGNSQGIIKIVSGALTPSPHQGEVRTIFESPVSAQLDGGQRIGMVVVSKAVDIAITKAKATGIAVVGCSNYASTTGALGMWTRRVTDQNLIGLLFSQCNEMVAPYGSYEAIYGTNPLSIGIPIQGPNRPILDMATSVMAYYEVHRRATLPNGTLPPNTAFNKEGRPTLDPKEALEGALQVFDRGLKGSHLALMVELLAGALPGAAMHNKGEAKNWGSLIVAIDANILGDGPGFIKRAEEMCERVKNAKTVDKNTEMLMPGERGDRLEAEQLAAGSVKVDEKVFKQLEIMASKP
eukprot:gene7553-8353_t